MVKRLMIQIDEEKCNGCGLCVPGCAEGALQVIDGKARLVSEQYCDGLGACIGECPQGALTLKEMDVVEFDEEAVKIHLQKMAAAKSLAHATSGCPGAQAMVLSTHSTENVSQGIVPERSPESKLSQWPIKLRLVSPQHPALNSSSLLVLSDCVGPAYAGLHGDFLENKSVVMVCPKFEDPNATVEKLAAIFALNDIKDVAVVHMAVPCCHGLLKQTSEAVSQSGKDIPLRSYVIGVKGNIKAVQ